MRRIKYYPPESRHYFEDNLQCLTCGNSLSFYIDLRLEHEVCLRTDQCMQVELTRSSDQIFAEMMRERDQLLYDENRVIFCANCKSDDIDDQERLLDCCWQVGCPGCSVCGNYISREEVTDCCMECLKDHNGLIEAEDCFENCPHFDEGLEEVRQHYNITLTDLKRELGFLV